MGIDNTIANNPIMGKSVKWSDAGQTELEQALLVANEHITELQQQLAAARERIKEEKIKGDKRLQIALDARDEAKGNQIAAEHGRDELQKIVNRQSYEVLDLERRVRRLIGEREELRQDMATLQHGNAELQRKLEEAERERKRRNHQQNITILNMMDELKEARGKLVAIQRQADIEVDRVIDAPTDEEGRRRGIVALTNIGMPSRFTGTTSTPLTSCLTRCTGEG